MPHGNRTEHDPKNNPKVVISSYEDPLKKPFLSLFAARKKTYPARVQGRFRRLKWMIMLITLTVYYLTPFIRWDRGDAAPNQAVLVDVPGRKFYFFFIELWPQEVYYFTGLLLLAAFLLFFATAVMGRVWCGYLCPQTVWTDLYVHVERWIEGDRNARMKLDASRWTLGKIGKKAAKHSIWLLIALCTGGAWVFYFNDAPTLWQHILGEGSVPFAAKFWIVALTFSTYLFAGHAREQVCTYMCPYARFQGAMFDVDSLIVAYDNNRGEPRGKPTESGGAAVGDCIDCGRCVAVCPMGIDIRHGQQYTCINCALCIDACNSVMDKLGRPRGLIRYNTFTGRLNKEHGFFTAIKHIRLVRPRTILYTLVLAALTSTMAYSLFVARQMTELSGEQVRNPLYVQQANGDIRNIYTLHIVNKQHTTNGPFLLSAENLPGASLSALNEGNTATGDVALMVSSSAIKNVRLFVDVNKAQLTSGHTAFLLVLKTPDGTVLNRYHTQFVAP